MTKKKQRPRSSLHYFSLACLFVSVMCQPGFLLADIITVDDFTGTPSGSDGFLEVDKDTSLPESTVFSSSSAHGGLDTDITMRFTGFEGGRSDSTFAYNDLNTTLAWSNPSSTKSTVEILYEFDGPQDFWTSTQGHYLNFDILTDTDANEGLVQIQLGANGKNFGSGYETINSTMDGASFNLLNLKDGNDNYLVAATDLSVVDFLKITFRAEENAIDFEFEDFGLGEIEGGFTEIAHVPEPSSLMLMAVIAALVFGKKIRVRPTTL